MKVCCISAKAQHGKDTAAKILKEYLESIGQHVLIIHYADLLKFICSQFFGWDGKKDEKGRTILQYIGTDTVGAKNPAYWVDWVIGFLKLFEDEWDTVLIPDCRYPIEFARMTDNFYSTILRIERPGFDNGLSTEQKNHRSETAMDDYPFDKVIQNNGSLEEFKEKLINYADVYLLKNWQ